MMKAYHKIKTVYARDPETKYRTLIDGQYATPELAYLADNEWVFTEKVDGTNIRISLIDNTLVVRGKTDKAEIPPFLLDTLLRIFPPRVLASVFAGDEDFCLYGEGYGAKIQKGGENYIPDDVSFVLFDVRVGGWWLTRASVIDVAITLGIDIVPPLGTGTLQQMVELVRAGFDSAWGSFPAEGIVAKPLVELAARSGHRIITKIKAKDFPK